MESFEVLEKAIPRAASDRIGRKLGIGGSLVRKWRREPESDDAPTATGQRNLLDRVEDLIDEVYLINPPGAGLIVEHIDSHYHALLRTHAQPMPCRDTQAAAGATLLTEATEAINALHTEGVTDYTLQQLVELRDAADATIKSVEKTLQQEETNP